MYKINLLNKSDNTHMHWTNWSSGFVFFLFVCLFVGWFFCFFGCLFVCLFLFVFLFCLFVFCLFVCCCCCCFGGRGQVFSKCYRVFLLCNQYAVTPPPDQKLRGRRGARLFGRCKTLTVTYQFWPLCTAKYPFSQYHVFLIVEGLDKLSGGNTLLLPPRTDTANM